MNEDRLKAYIKLINSLLTCAKGQGVEILNANQDLIDVGLVETMEGVATILVERGDRNAADWLRNIAAQLAAAIGNSPQTNLTGVSQEEGRTSALPENRLSQAYLYFLINLLQKTQESDGNVEVVYPLLQANLNKLDDKFVQVLQTWASSTIAEVDRETGYELAGDINSFSKLIAKFPHGDRAINLEIAIAGYLIVEKVFTRDRFPAKWASLQNNLGNAYRDRIRGERANNLEAAITYYLSALLEDNREKFPQNHAETQFNLGITYQEAGQLHNAYLAFATTIETIESLRRPLFLGKNLKKTLAEEWHPVYQSILEVSLELAAKEPGYYVQALEYIKQSQSPKLIEFLTTKNHIVRRVGDELQCLRQDMQ